MLMSAGAFMDEFLDEVFEMIRASNVDLQKRFSCSPDGFHVSGCKRLSQLSIDRGLANLAG